MTQPDRIAALERQVALLADRLGNAETGLSVLLSIVIANQRIPTGPIGAPPIGRLQ
jgi:hypothetical protein